MSRRYSHSRRVTGRRSTPKPLVGFIILASFGILFAGCSGPEDVEGDDLVFTEDDVTRYRELADEARTGSGATGSGERVPFIEPLDSGSGSSQDEVVLDLSSVDAFKSMRMGAASAGANMYQVTNDFLNIRETPSTGGKNVARIEFGQSVELIEFFDGQWAKVKVPGGAEGYVAYRYLSKVTSEERMAEEKKQFENMYYVSFGFVNMRKEANQGSEKIGEIPGQKIVKPLSIENGWAKVSYEGKEGFVSTSYLAPITPNFIVRQETYDLPVLHYRLAKDQEKQLVEAIAQHVNALRADGYSFMTLRDLHDLLLRQQQRDVRLDPKKVVVAVSGITADNYRSVSDALNTNGITATLFLETQHVGISGITEKNLLTLMANGFDIQSGTHTGDDLRALTNAQVELELKQSRQILESYTRKPVFAVAYAQGGVNDRVAQLAAEAGYLFGVGDDADRSFTRGQFLRIPAMIIFPSMSADEVMNFVKGGS